MDSAGRFCFAAFFVIRRVRTFQGFFSVGMLHLHCLCLKGGQIGYFQWSGAFEHGNVCRNAKNPIPPEQNYHFVPIKKSCFEQKNFQPLEIFHLRSESLKLQLFPPLLTEEHSSYSECIVTVSGTLVPFFFMLQRLWMVWRSLELLGRRHRWRKEKKAATTTCWK